MNIDQQLYAVAINGEPCCMTPNMLRLYTFAQQNHGWQSVDSPLRVAAERLAKLGLIVLDKKTRGTWSYCLAPQDTPTPPQRLGV